ncbi:hypothetical protein GCM10009725_25500 [Aeromicrobium tamlense]
MPPVSGLIAATFAAVVFAGSFGPGDSFSSPPFEHAPTDSTRAQVTDSIRNFMPPSMPEGVWAAGHGTPVPVARPGLESP